MGREAVIAEDDPIFIYEIDDENKHLPIEVPADHSGYAGGWGCADEKCRYKVNFPTASSMDNYKRFFAERHTIQFNKNRAQDITVDWDISAYCSVCEDGIGTVIVVDGDTIRCTDCGTTWSMDGTGGLKKDGDD